MKAKGSATSTLPTDAMAMLTVRETAKRLTISLSSAYDLIHSGELPHYRIGGAIRISEADFQDFLAAARLEKP